MTDPNETREGTFKVRVYFKSNRRHEFHGLDYEHAKEMASRIVSEYCWVINADGTDEFYPTTEIEKAKVLLDDQT